MKHELKIWPEFYERVRDGEKTFEVRTNDRNFQCGDFVVLKEWDPKARNSADPSVPSGYTGSPDLEFKIGFVFVLDKNTVVFSLLKSRSSNTQK